MRNGQYYVVLGSDDANGNGLVLLYRLDNLMNWTYVNVLAKSDGRLGDNWECPGLFPLGDKDVFMLSPQRIRRRERLTITFIPRWQSLVGSN